SRLFQSAPGDEAGRNRLRERRNASALKFQSAPGDEAGRNAWDRLNKQDLDEFQSAPGDEAGRNRVSAPSQHRPAGFNPLPAMKPGGTGDRGAEWIRRLVSIRSRR